MKDKMIKAALSFAVLCGLGACTKNYLDINSNPYEVDKEQMEAKDYAIASGLSAMFGTVVSTDVNTAQFTDCLLGSTQGGYYADANNGWTNTISKYNPTDNWTNVFMYSDKVIPQLYSNMSNVEGISEDPLVLAILKIVKVCVLNRVTDTYGPIPYSEIGSTGKIQVAYDDQPKVYSQMFDELDEAIALLDENIDRSITSTTDQVFDGTAVKWCRFANSMKLRLAMRVVYTDFVSSKGLSPQQLGEQAHRPLLERLGKNRVVSVGDHGAYDGHGLVKLDAMLGGEQANELGDDHGGVRVVNLDHGVVGQIVQVAAALDGLVDQELGGVAHHEVLLIDAK